MVGKNLVGNAVSADRNGAVNVGTPHPHILLEQCFHDFRVRVAVGIACTKRDDAVTWPYVAHELGQGGSPAPVMRDLHHVGLDILAMRQQPSFGAVLNIAGEEDPHLAVLQQQDKRAVVLQLGIPGRAVVLRGARRRQHREPKVAPVPLTATVCCRVVPGFPAFAGNEDVAQVAFLHRGAVGKQVLRRK